MLAEILVAAGIPDGVFNLVSGAGSMVGNAIVAHEEVDAISFTGSVPVDQTLAKRAIEG